MKILYTTAIFAALITPALAQRQAVVQCEMGPLMTYAAEPICDALQAGFARLVFEGSEVAKSVGDCAETMGRILHQSPRYYDGTCLRMETQTYRIIAAEVMRRERRS